MVRPLVSEGICIRCKGARLLCGKSECPILKKYSILKSVVPFKLDKIQRNKVIFGASPPAVFVGRRGYPNVSMGPMVPIEELFERNIPNIPNLLRKDTRILDLSEFWFGKGMDEIITFRSALVRSNFQMNVKIGTISPKQSKLLDDIIQKLPLKQKRLLESSQELAMAKNSVDTETYFDKLRTRMTYDVHSPPLGPSGMAEEIKIIDNIKTHPKIEYVVDDLDLKATDAIVGYLYPTQLQHSMDSELDLNNPTKPSANKIVFTTEIQRLLSTGLLGTKKDRRIVPTRWSITAVDSIISKYLASKIKGFPEINEYYTFHEKFLDNNFVILFMPGPWSYEMMEVWYSNTIWTQPVPGVQKRTPPNMHHIVEDYELESGRTTYASNVTGAYYAARKEVTEFLFKERKQARCIVFREVRGGYIVPLGVWVIRETVRSALKNGFKSKNMQKADTLAAALQRVSKEMKLPLKEWIKASKLLKNLRIQRRLDEWIKFQPKKIAK
ncbi:MAG: hypothetical protein ACTSO2_16800 [Promethearchaeota archaeon]